MTIVDQAAARASGRRHALRALGGLGALGLLSCTGGSGSSSTGNSAGSGSGGGTTTTGCVLIPEETGGPYPLFDTIAEAAVYQRQDITDGKTGVPFDLTLTIVNVNNSCAPITDAMVYAWHCDKDGLYSGYSQPGSDTTGETFCRGVQTTDSSGQVRFTTIYPGWYAGRITHIHFRVYLGNNLSATSQLAFPQEITAAVYESELYAARGQNSSVGSFASDNVFADGTTYQMLTVTGNASTGGYSGALTVGIMS